MDVAPRSLPVGCRDRRSIRASFRIAERQTRDPERSTDRPLDARRLSDFSAKPDESHGARHPTCAIPDCIWWPRSEVAPQCRHPTQFPRLSWTWEIYASGCMRRATFSGFAEKSLRRRVSSACSGSLCGTRVCLSRVPQREPERAPASGSWCFLLDAGVALRRIATLNRSRSASPDRASAAASASTCCARAAADRHRRQVVGVEEIDARRSRSCRVPRRLRSSQRKNAFQLWNSDGVCAVAHCGRTAPRA